MQVFPSLKGDAVSLIESILQKQVGGHVSLVSGGVGVGGDRIHTPYLLFGWLPRARELGCRPGYDVVRTTVVCRPTLFIAAFFFPSEHGGLLARCTPSPKMTETYSVASRHHEYTSTYGCIL